MVRVVKYSIRLQDEVFGIGEIINNLSHEVENKLIELGYAERIKDNGLTDLTVEEVKKNIKDVNNIILLQEALEIEENGKKRKGIIKNIKSRINELEDSQKVKEYGNF